MGLSEMSELTEEAIKKAVDEFLGTPLMVISDSAERVRFFDEYANEVTNDDPRWGHFMAICETGLHTK